MSLLLKKIFWGVFFVSIQLHSQQFYVNSVLTMGNNTNKVYKFDFSNTIQIDEPFCPPTMGPYPETYTDIAIDASNNLYYVTTLGLLYRKNYSTSICEFLGDFTTTNASIKALTSDSGKYIYGIGSPSKLYRYDIITGTFTDMGNLPTGQYVAGDLFFYERRLFVSTTTGILEINMMNPSQSCPFMTLGLSNIFATFSINYGTYSKAYVILSAFASSTLHELDMVNQQLGPPIRTFDHMVNGAAAIYDLTSTSSSCTLSLNTQESIVNDVYFNVINPVNKNIICKTNLKREQITFIRLFDSSGRLIKDFSNQSNIENLEISNISSGTYLLTVSTKNGETYTKKLIIKS